MEKPAYYEKNQRYYLKNRQTIIDKAAEYNAWVGQNTYFCKNYIIPTRLRMDNYKCVKCSSDRYLAVHHKSYDIANLTINDFETLCKSCHTKLHNKKDSGCGVSQRRDL